MDFCGNCGSVLREGTKFCPECGTKIIDNGAKFCTECGKMRNGMEKFCSQCGTPFDQAPINTVPEVDGNHNKSLKKGIVIAAIVAMIVLIGGAAWYFLGNQQDKYSIEKLALVTNEMDLIEDFHEGLAFFMKNEKLGVVNKMGDIIVDPIYDLDEYFFIDGTARVIKNGKYGFINKEGKEFVPCKYEYAEPFSEGLATVKKDGKCGFLDKNGKEVIPLIYSSATSFSNGLSAVGKNGKYGYINKKGETIIPFIFDYADSFDGEAAIASKNDNSVIINKKGEVIKEFKSGQLNGSSDGMIVYINDENDRYGFVDEKGNVIPCVYYAYRATFGRFNNGYASVYKYEDDVWVTIDKSGKEIHFPKFDNVSNFSEGLFCAWKKDKVGFCDTNGKCVIPCTFDAARSFSEGLAAVKQGELWGFIDMSGKMVINPLFDEVCSFSDGLAVVMKNGIWGVVDKEGNNTFDVQDEEVRKIVDARLTKERIKQRLERIFDDAVTGNVRNCDDYFSYDFKRSYEAVQRYDEVFHQGEVGFWDGGFWDMAQDNFGMSIVVKDVYDIKEYEAMAKVTFTINYSNGNDVYNEDIKVIFEDGKWVLDDLHGYKKQMKEYINE